PTTLRSDESCLSRLAELTPDVGVTAAYGRILPPRLLDIPRHGVLNVHASLLPKYRGAAPIQWALIDGAKETGVSIMQTEAGLDTGPVRLQRRVAIQPHETAPQLMDRLAVVGAEALSEVLELLAADALPSRPQDDAAATLAPLLTAEDGHVRWGDTANAISDRFRGVAAWPGTSFVHDGKRVKVLAMEPVDGADPRSSVPAATEPGTVLDIAGQGVAVATGRGALRLQLVKPPGGR